MTAILFQVIHHYKNDRLHLRKTYGVKKGRII